MNNALPESVLLEGEHISVERSMVVSEGYKSGHYVYCVLRGQLRILYQGRREKALAGAVVWLGGGRERHVETAGPSSWRVLRIRNRLFGRHAPVDRLAFGQLMDLARLSERGPVLDLQPRTRETVFRMGKQLCALPGNGAGLLRRKGALLELFGCLQADELLAEKMCRLPAGNRDLDRLQAVMEILDTGGRDGCGVEELARRAGLSRSSLYRLFRDNGFPSPARLLLQGRLEEADRRLREGNETVLAVAMASGFGSLSTFYRSYRRRFGYSPGSLRPCGRASHSPNPG